MGAGIVGLGVALPERIVSNDAIAPGLGVTAGWIEQRTGVRSRRWVSPGEDVLSLASAASQQALEASGIPAPVVDVVVVATCSAERTIPAIAPQVATAIGADRAAAYDTNAGCAGFLYALAQASAAIEAGYARTAVVCGTDTLSRVVDHSDARSSVLFGDGAGAVILRAGSKSGLGPFRLRSDGARPEQLCIDLSTGLLHMDGRDVYRRAVEEMSEGVAGVLKEADLGLEDVSLVVAHQANRRILEAVAERLELPLDKMAIDIDSYGNTSAASIPIALSSYSARGRLRDGDLIVLAAFGAGYAWGAGLARWGPEMSRV